MNDAESALPNVFRASYLGFLELPAGRRVVAPVLDRETRRLHTPLGHIEGVMSVRLAERRARRRAAVR